MSDIENKTTPPQWDPLHCDLWIAIDRVYPKLIFSATGKIRRDLEFDSPGRYLFMDPTMVIHFFNQSMLRIGLQVNGMLAMSIDPHYITVLDENRNPTDKVQQVEPVLIGCIDAAVGDFVIPFPTGGIDPNDFIRHDKGEDGKILYSKMKKAFR